MEWESDISLEFLINLDPALLCSLVETTANKASVVITTARDYIEDEEICKQNNTKNSMSAKSKQKLLLEIKLGEIRRAKEYERKRVQMDPSVLSSLNSTDYETDMKKIKHKNNEDMFKKVSNKLSDRDQPQIKSRNIIINSKTDNKKGRVSQYSNNITLGPKKVEEMKENPYMQPKRSLKKASSSSKFSNN